MRFKFISTLISILFSLLMIYSVVTSVDSGVIANPAASGRIEMVSPAGSTENENNPYDHGCPYLRQAIEKGCPAFTPENSTPDANTELNTHML